MILSRMLEFAALRYPDREAVVDGSKRLTYAQLHERVCRLASSLAKLGVGKGDRVLLTLKNREEFVTAHFAAQRLGATTTPISFRLAAGEMAYCLADAKPAVAIFGTDTRDSFLEALNGSANGAGIPPAHAGKVTAPLSGAQIF